jgi:phytoene synthase
MDVLTYNALAQFEQVNAEKEEKSNFKISFSFLPREERIAMNSVYAFCSYIDGIVDRTSPADESIARKEQRLNWWEGVIDLIYDDKMNNPLILPFIKVIKRFRIPKQYLITIIDGCRRDLIQNRYDTFVELKEYCHAVASVVGLISIEIFGYKYEETKNYAINLGYALQLTNILRDIKADKDRGYIYIPKEDMEKFGYTEDELINEVYNENFVELMRFQALRARQYYHKARRLLHPEERVTTFAAGIMDEIYFRILEKIELAEYDIFNKKIRVSQIHKLMITLKHWLSLVMFIKPRRKK